MVILFCGMSGIDINSSLANFIRNYKPFRSSNFDNRVPEVVKIDTELENVFYELNPHIEKANNVWVDVILHQSYPVLEKLWAVAFDKIFIKVQTLEHEGRPIFLNLHSCYLHNKTKEYISLLQIDKLRK